MKMTRSSSVVRLSTLASPSSSWYSKDLCRRAVMSLHSLRNASGRLRYVVQLMPLTGNGARESSSACSSGGCVYERLAGRTPPAIIFPLTSGTGNVKGMLRARVVLPALVRSSKTVGALIECQVIGSLFETPGLCSRMSKTPWPAGFNPVMKDGHAHQEWDGTVDRQSP